MLVVFQGASEFAELVAPLRTVNGLGDARLQGGFLPRPKGMLNVIPDGPHGGAQAQQNDHCHYPRTPVQSPLHVRHGTCAPL